jgi:hypothetical protein
MSLLGYQQALCDMVASPQLCLRVRAAAAALDGYDLTKRERRRLAAVAAQRGMSTSCTLYRVNRIAPLHAYLPLTCTLLGDELIREAERFWGEGKPGDLQFGPETQRFGRFLQRRLQEGAIADPYLGEVLALELAANALRWGAQPPTRTVPFVHEPVALLAPLADGRRPDHAVPPGDYAVVVDATESRITLSVAVPSKLATSAPVRRPGSSAHGSGRGHSV